MKKKLIMIATVAALGSAVISLPAQAQRFGPGLGIGLAVGALAAGAMANSYYGPYGYGSYYGPRPYYGGYGYGGYGYRYGGGWGGSTTNVRVNEILVGTIVIDVIDANKQEVAWRGMGVKEVDTQAKTEKRDKNINEAVAKLLKNFPPPVKK